MMHSAAPHEIVIEPNRNGLRIDWRELWEYRDLLGLLVRRDFVAKYKQTILGPAWFVLQPLLTTIVFTVVFGHVAKVSTDGLPRPLFYLCGLVAWNYFAQNLTGASATFTASASLFEKVYFPRLIIPLSVIISNLAAFALSLVTFLAFLVYYKLSGAAVTITPYALLLPLLVLHTAALSFGVTLWFSSLTAKYRDLSHLTGFLTQLWMFATPVIYPVSEVPEKWRWVAAINPMTAIVEAFRACFLGVSSLQPVWLASSAVTTLVLLITGVLMFRKTERTFVDTV